MLIASITLTLAPNYISILIGKLIYQMGIIFLNISSAILKNNLEIQHKEQEFIKMQTRLKYSIFYNYNDNFFCSRIYV